MCGRPVYDLIRRVHLWQSSLVHYSIELLQQSHGVIELWLVQIPNNV